MSKTQQPRPDPVDEIGEPHPLFGIGRLVREDLGEQVEVERRADHRGVAEQQAIVRLQCVDANRQQRLDRLGQGIVVGRRNRQFADEERVACRTLGDGSELVLGQRDVPRRSERKGACLCGVERLELERQDLGRGEWQARWSPRGDDEPGPWPRLGELREQELRRVVQPVHVLNEDHRRHEQHAGEELVEDVVQPIAPERGIDLVDLPGVRHFGVERQGEQRQPLSEVGHHGLRKCGQLRAGTLA